MVALSLVLAGPANGVDTATDKIIAAARSDNRAMRHATHIAGKIGPRLTGSKQLARAERWTRDQFESFGLANVHLEKWARMESPHTRSGEIAVHNVVADIPGTDLAGEYVVVGAHLDSWDFAHGATDNAAGCAAVMEAARLIMASGVQPRRTIRFILWTGEEQGLLGSSAYVAAHPDLLGKISAVFNMDAGTNPVSGLVVTEPMRADLEAVFAPLTADNREFRLQTTASLALPADCCSQTLDPATGTCTGSKASCTLPPGESGCPSDHVAFLRAGVPAFIFEQAGAADYARTHHSALDRVEELDAVGIEQSALVIAIAATGVADLPKLLSRDNLIARAETMTGAGKAWTPSSAQ